VVGNQGSNVDGGNGLVGVLLGKGDGTFQKVLTYDSGASGLSSIAVADLNKDGRPDVVVVNCGTDTVLLMFYDPQCRGRANGKWGRHFRTRRDL
jgi:hypothetical protein